MQKNGFKLLVMALLLVMIGTLGYMVIKGNNPASKLEVMKKAPDFKLDNIDGKPISLAELSGRSKLIYFFYSTCPDVCQPTTYTLSKVQDALVKKGVFGDKTAITSISFDPSKDTTEQLQKFSKSFHADPKGWYFLRGDEAAVIDLAQKYGVMVVKDKEGGTFTHNNVILLVDKKGDLRTYYNGSDPDLDVDKIAEDMIGLSKE
ncbi:SCO family protein [Paenibacillus sp. S3N08]|uniref:SCO family protein n=2 Tax=Paenibacillus agricola TaxID=2716264 RepID=A0ABX0J349_9BACL|nr:SCO family protein [Paenibacillus agricola]